MKYSSRRMTDGELFALNRARRTAYTEGVVVLSPSGLIHLDLPGTFRDRHTRWLEAVRITLELNKGTAQSPRVA